MKYKFYYYDEQKICILAKSLDEKPNIESIGNENSIIKISLETKTVDNLYDFFKNYVIEQLLGNEPQQLEIEYDEISECQFYENDSFSKLKDLIENTKNKCNETLTGLKNDSSIDEENFEIENTSGTFNENV